MAQRDNGFSPMPRSMHHPTAIELPCSRADFDEIIDVRSPAEYAEDHIPGAVNLPVLDDTQRARVGTEFRRVGSFEAKRLGAGLISANISRHLTTHFADKPRSYRPLVYCWRGGQRSQSLATILSAIGWQTSYIENGYKSYRKWVIAGLCELPEQFKWFAINGLTGSGKTRLLKLLSGRGEQVLDLEAIARHRGSVLGLDPDLAQPSQKAFEGEIHHVLSSFDPDRPVFVEAESKKVGNLHCPESLWRAMTSATVIQLDVPTGERVTALLEDYRHFLADPQLLAQRVALLRERHGGSQIAAWEQLITQHDWHEFVRSILETHYDPSYRRSTRYPEPACHLELADLSPASIEATCRQVIDLAAAT